MTTLDRYQARRRLQDGELLIDKPGGHARWKLGKDTVRDVTVQHWVNQGDIKETFPGIYAWVGK